MQSVIAGFYRSGIKLSNEAIGITERETTLFGIRTQGFLFTVPLSMIRWQTLAENLKNQGYVETFHPKTGLVIDAYFSATKVR